jgi:hypothetical protein
VLVMVIERQRSRSGIFGVLIGLLVVAAVIIAVVVVFAKSDNSAKRDVTVQACNPDVNGAKPTASGQIVNHSSKTSNYVVRLKFTDAQGNQVAEGVNGVKAVAPGATASWTLKGDRAANGPVKCIVTGVSRTHIPGQ